MSIPLTKNFQRIESIDLLRGAAMIIMALDHVRDYFHITANVDNPLNFQTTTPELFFTRWITHFCAPVFIFLSGTSIYLQGLRKSKKDLSGFLIKRGLWLIFAEVAIVSFGWSFNPHYQYLFLQVIWAIGISMVILGLLVHLPYRLLLALGLLLVCGHNLLDIPESAPGFEAGFWWDLLHHGFFTPYAYAENHSVFIVYPFAAWTGVMLLGYCAGIFYSNRYTPEQRQKILRYIGLGMILLFVALRIPNIYGDPDPWETQKTGLFSFLSFINTTKYPPSLLFLCMTLGPSLIVLSYLENIRNKLTDILRVYGRVAFFYYILHIYLIHLLAMISFFAHGHSWDEATKTGSQFPFFFLVPGEGFHLPMVYLVWAFVVISLYPLCQWYNRYKSEHPEKWWLSYL
ncbi:MAG TPA: heparan-alpha-glucosaminide N-acetyltransferase domain-containing protein [Saprospiraceae bacterium]|nr:heparan-alpha-glucosaminide N-acetyltransferase domain-containing protein [Saprospiraceae bacterium]